MPPLPDLRFSSASLQDFLDCPRRFDLHYRKALRWPAVEAEPIGAQERRMALGKAFHQLVQQHTVGLSAELVRRASLDPDMAPELADWWQNYLAYRPVDLFRGKNDHALVRSELTLEGWCAGHRVVVRYDLLILVPGERAIILDWKTSAKRASERTLAASMQTRTYRYLLVEAGGWLNGGDPIEPEQVEMVYWFPEFPDSPARLPYDAVRYVEDGDVLSALISEIVAMEDGDFEMVNDERHCRLCTYRSYCDRGVQAATVEDVAAAWELQEQGVGLDVDFDSIAEIEY